MRTDPQVNFRIEQDILDRLKASAKASGRSITAEVNYRLSESVPTVTVVKTQLRMPSGLHNRIQAACKESGRSMNAETVYRLQESFDACIADRPSGSSTLESSIDPKPIPRQARKRAESAK